MNSKFWFLYFKIEFMIGAIFLKTIIPHRGCEQNANFSLSGI